MIEIILIFIRGWQPSVSKTGCHATRLIKIFFGKMFYLSCDCLVYILLETSIWTCLNSRGCAPVLSVGEYTQPSTMA
jgi:hypothetical protein